MLHSILGHQTIFPQRERTLSRRTQTPKRTTMRFLNGADKSPRRSLRTGWKWLPCLIYMGTSSFERFFLCALFQHVLICPLQQPNPGSRAQHLRTAALLREGLTGEHRLAGMVGKEEGGAGNGNRTNRINNSSRRSDAFSLEVKRGMERVLSGSAASAGSGPLSPGLLIKRVAKPVQWQSLRLSSYIKTDSSPQN